MMIKSHDVHKWLLVAGVHVTASAWDGYFYVFSLFEDYQKFLFTPHSIRNSL